MKYNFALQKGDKSQEAVAVHQTSILDGHKVQYFGNYKDVPPDFIPCGSVEWCLKILGRPVIPDYYPEFLKPYLHRDVWQTNEWPLGKRIFIKPADKYKRFTGFVTNGTYRGKKKGPYWCSEVVQFKNEWRYYVSNGRILECGWYWGDELEMPDAPYLNIEFPPSYCGAVDFGETEIPFATLSLIEANHPFACGWYGKFPRLYTQWVIDGWEYMKKLK